MSLISLITRDVKRVQIKTVSLDAAIEETHIYSADVTETPVEKGYDITDHVILKPTKLTIRGIVSRTPLNGFGPGSVANSLIGAGINNVLGSANSLVGAPFGGVTRAAAAAGVGSLATLVSLEKTPENAYKDLVDLYNDRIPFDVYTRLSQYKNMVISNLNFPRNATIGRNLEFTIELTQVTVVSSLGFKISKETLGVVAKNRGAGSKDLGAKGTKAAGAKTGAAAGSTLYKKVEPIATAAGVTI